MTDRSSHDPYAPAESPVPNGDAAEVIEWIGQDLDRAAAAYAVELGRGDSVRSEVEDHVRHLYANT